MAGYKVYLNSIIFILSVHWGLSYGDTNIIILNGKSTLQINAIVEI